MDVRPVIGVSGGAPTPGRGGDAADLDRSMAHELLGTYGCPACAHAVAAVDRYVAWFMAEGHAFPETRDRLCASLGFCPVHTRRVITRPGAAERITRLYPAVLDAARTRLHGASATRAACPVCASGDEAGERAVDVITGMLDEAPVARRFAECGGFCLRHAATAVRLRQREWRSVMAVLAGRLDTAVEEATICGRGEENPVLVAAQRALLPSAGFAGGGAAEAASSLRRAARRLDVDACPVCLAYGQLVRRYLSWLAGVSRHDPGVLRTEAGGLCPAHLRELTVVDADAGAWALCRERDRVRARLTETHAFAPVGGPGGRAGRRRLRAAGAAARADVLTALGSRRCLACDAAHGYARAERDLLLAALGDRAFRRAYEHAHGLCLRHVLAVPDGPGPVREVLGARLDICAWELADCARKREWAYRHEATGPESAAWFRALALLDGEVFLGGPGAGVANAPGRR